MKCVSFGKKMCFLCVLTNAVRRGMITVNSFWGFRQRKDRALQSAV